MAIRHNPARAYNRGPWMVCTLDVLDGPGIRQVPIHARAGLIERQPKLLSAMMRAGTKVSPWMPLPDGVQPTGLVLATPKVVIKEDDYIRIREVKPEDLVEEAA